MENVNITGVNCGVPNVKLAGNDRMNHIESVSLQYEKITWKIIDGNIHYSDAWNERPVLQVLKQSGIKRTVQAFRNISFTDCAAERPSFQAAG